MITSYWFWVRYENGAKSETKRNLTRTELEELINRYAFDKAVKSIFYGED